jgi:hypothetical protein
MRVFFTVDNDGEKSVRVPNMKITIGEFKHLAAKKYKKTLGGRNLRFYNNDVEYRDDDTTVGEAIDIEGVQKINIVADPIIITVVVEGVEIPTEIDDTTTSTDLLDSFNNDYPGKNLKTVFYGSTPYWSLEPIVSVVDSDNPDKFYLYEMSRQLQVVMLDGGNKKTKSVYIHEGTTVKDLKDELILSDPSLRSLRIVSAGLELRDDTNMNDSRYSMLETVHAISKKIPEDSEERSVTLVSENGMENAKLDFSSADYAVYLKYLVATYYPGSDPYEVTVNDVILDDLETLGYEINDGNVVVRVVKITKFVPPPIIVTPPRTYHINDYKITSFNDFSKLWKRDPSMFDRHLILPLVVDKLDSSIKLVAFHTNSRTYGDSEIYVVCRLEKNGYSN